MASTSTPDARSRGPAVVLACLLLTTFVLAAHTRAPDRLVAPAPAIALKPPRLASYAEDACTSCHAGVAAEWATTAHAVAWVDEEYQEQLRDKKKPETCWGCHVPKPLLAGDLAKKPEARGEARGLGITCASCHVGTDGRVLGPRGTHTSAHVSEVSETFTTGRSNALCVSCHRFNVGPVIGVAKDFEELKLADAGFSCVACHFAEVEMRYAEKHGDEDPPLRRGRSHALQTPRDPAFLAQAFECVLEEREGATVVLVRNRAGHRVPGLIGRKIEIEARALDAAGGEIGRRTLTLDATSYLPVGDALPIALGVRAARVRVTGQHLDPRGDTPVSFLDLELAGAR